MLVVALLLVANTAGAADGQIPDDTLAQFGLGGAEVVSDAQGEEIRGKFLFGPTFIGQVALLIYNANPSPATAHAADRFIARATNVNVRLATRNPTHPVLASPVTHYIPYLPSFYGGGSY
jgi:hypothetical protein